MEPTDAGHNRIPFVDDAAALARIRLLKNCQLFEHLCRLEQSLAVLLQQRMVECDTAEQNALQCYVEQMTSPFRSEDAYMQQLMQLVQSEHFQ